MVLLSFYSLSMGLVLPAGGVNNYSLVIFLLVDNWITATMQILFLRSWKRMFLRFRAVASIVKTKFKKSSIQDLNTSLLHGKPTL